MIALLLCACLTQDPPVDPVKEKAAADALAKFQAAWDASKETEARVAAVEALGKVEHPKVLAKLAGLLTSGNTIVRQGVVRVLGRWKELRPEVSRALVGALPTAGKDVDLNVDLIDAIARVGDRTAAPAVIARFDDKVIE